MAIILGVIMLSAISHITLSTGQSPFASINNEINPVLGWGWAIATIMANVVWCLPQFSLGTAAVTQNLIPALNNTGGKVLICALLTAAFLVVRATTKVQLGENFRLGIKNYGGSGCNFIFWSRNQTKYKWGSKWGSIIAGFIPNFLF